MTVRMGQQIDNYRLTQFLGAGGFGEVYLGEHIYHKTQVAIKILPQLDRDDLPDFLNEARTFRLKHPNIVHILDFGVEKGSYTPFLVMDYAPNGSLRQRHPKGTLLPLPTVISYVTQIASALQYAHDERLIHRDVKPANMLLGLHNEVLLGDFGAALIARSSFFRMTQTVIGSATYMAPEQLQGKPCFASDQYSLAIVVYEWLCGDVPFHGTSFELYHFHLNVPPPSLRTKNPAISPDVEQVVMRALAKDPEQRFASVQAFADALQQANQIQAASPKLYLPPPTMYPPNYAIEQTQAVLSPQSFSATVAVPQNSSQAHKRVTSRRMFLGMGLGALVVLSGGTAVWLVANEPGQDSTPKPGSTPTPTTVPTPRTTILTYDQHGNEVFAVAWSPDSNDIASSGGDIHTRKGDTAVRVWEAQTGKTLQTYDGHTKVVRSVAWSPDGKRIASAGEDKTVQVWDASTGENVSVYAQHSGAVRSVAWSPDGKHIASASEDGTVQVWDADTANNSFTYTGHSSAVYTVAWSSDGKHIASGSEDKTVQIWDTTAGDNVVTSKGHTSYVGAVAWSPSGAYIASGGYDKTVRIWDAATGTAISTYGDGYSFDQVYTVSWSPENTHIVFGGNDGTVQIWEVKTGMPIYKYTNTYTKHTQPIMAAPWSPSGTYIASGGFDHVVRVWQPPQGTR